MQKLDVQLLTSLREGILAEVLLLTTSAMKEALVRARLVTEERAEAAPLVPRELLALWEEVEQLKARLPVGDNPPTSGLLGLQVSMFMAWGDQKGALEAIRDAMRRRLEELAL